MNRIAAGRLAMLLHRHLYRTVFVRSSPLGGWFVPRTF